jgi:hypothetical protein
VRSELARRRHPVRTVGDLEGPCSVEIIRRDAMIGMLLAGSDPRRDGWAVALVTAPPLGTCIGRDRKSRKFPVKYVKTKR